MDEIDESINGLVNLQVIKYRRKGGWIVDKGMPKMMERWKNEGW